MQRLRSFISLRRVLLAGVVATLARSCAAARAAFLAAFHRPPQRVTRAASALRLPPVLDRQARLPRHWQKCVRHPLLRHQRARNTVRARRAPTKTAHVPPASLYFEYGRLCSMCTPMRFSHAVPAMLLMLRNQRTNEILHDPYVFRIIVATAITSFGTPFRRSLTIGLALYAALKHRRAGCRFRSPLPTELTHSSITVNWRTRTPGRHARFPGKRGHCATAPATALTVGTTALNRSPCRRDLPGRACRRVRSRRMHPSPRFGSPRLAMFQREHHILSSYRRRRSFLAIPRGVDSHPLARSSRSDRACRCTRNSCLRCRHCCSSAVGSY